VFPSIQFQVRLVHADSGLRVVEVTALRGTTPLGSALGEAANAEEADQRALDRLLGRLGPLEETPPATAMSPAATNPPVPPPANPAANPPESPAAHPPGPAPSTAAPTSRSGPRLPPAPAPLTTAGGPARPSPTTTTPAAAPPPPTAPPPAATEPPADPEDWSSELARLDLELRRLGWSREQEAAYLHRAFGHPSRSRLTSYADLKAYLSALEALSPGSEPASSPVPLRRRDLLAQSNQLLVALGWNGEQGRRFLEQELGVASRQQLADDQLLQFNMLLEGELLERDRASETMHPPSAPPP
jgi:hypothetical protein